MQREERLLDDVLDERLAARLSPRDGAGEGKDAGQKPAIGLGVALLGGGEQRFPGRLRFVGQFRLPPGGCNLKPPAAEIAGEGGRS